MSLVLHEYKTKTDLLDEIKERRAKLDALFDRIPKKRMLIPGVVENWTGKDLLAHIMVYDHWISGEIDHALRHGLPPRSRDVDYGDTDQRNHYWHTYFQEEPLDQLKADARRVYADLIAAIEAASEDRLNMPVTFDEHDNLVPTTWDAPPMPVLWPLWRWITDQTSEHYPQHYQALERWIAAK